MTCMAMESESRREDYSSLQGSQVREVIFVVAQLLKVMSNSL